MLDIIVHIEYRLMSIYVCMRTWAEITLRQHHLWPSQCFVLIKPVMINSRDRKVVYCEISFLYELVGFDQVAATSKVSIYRYLQSDSTCPLQF